MAHVREMQQGPPIDALEMALDYAGGRADVRVACAGDLARVAPTAREALEAPTDPTRRAGFLARRALARRAVAHRLGRDAAEIAIAHDASGAPRLVAPACALHVSLSGRDDIAAIAVADRPVGVDVEPIGAPFDPPLNVLHPAERAALAAAGAGAHELLLRYWTAKEAYLKALGTGLTREPTEIEIQFAARAAKGDRDIAVLDRTARVRLAASLSRRLGGCGQPLILACVVLAA